MEWLRDEKLSDFEAVLSEPPRERAIAKRNSVQQNTHASVYACLQPRTEAWRHAFLLQPTGEPAQTGQCNGLPALFVITALKQTRRQPLVILSQLQCRCIPHCVVPQCLICIDFPGLRVRSSLAQCVADASALHQASFEPSLTLIVFHTLQVVASPT